MLGRLQNSLVGCFGKMKQMAEFPVEGYEVGERLDRHLKKSPLGWIRAQVLLRKGEIKVRRVDGSMSAARDYRLEAGDTLLLAQSLRDEYTRKQNKSEISQSASRSILSSLLLYQNQNVAVINKPAGYTVQGGTEASKNIFTLMAAKYQKQVVHVTHRLDKVTSGLVLLAKNRQSAQCIQMAMQERQSIHKYYLALTESDAAIEKPDYIRCNIEWTSKNKARVCSEASPASKDCVTYYVPLVAQQFEQTWLNLLGVKLLTGRKHQIRCHLSNYLNAPIVNDTKYSTKNPADLERENDEIYLHSFGLRITNRQVLEKVFSKSRESIFPEAGTVVKSDNQIEFYAGLPSHWSKYNSLVSKLPPLETVGRGIEGLQRKNRSKKPTSRNVTLLT